MVSLLLLSYCFGTTSNSICWVVKSFLLGALHILLGGLLVIIG